MAKRDCNEKELESNNESKSSSKRFKISEPDEQLPGTSKEFLYDQSIIDNPAEESVLENVPSESNEICVNEVNPNKDRTNYDFWSISSDDENNSSEIADTILSEIKLNQLFIGKIVNKILKIRVTYIIEIRNTKSGHVLTFHLKDRFKEIAVINFGHGCENLYSNLKINNIISIKNFAVNQENKKFPSGSGNTLEIRLNNESEIDEVDDDKSIPEISFKFVGLKEIQSLNKNDGTVVTLWSINAEKFSAEQFSVVVIRKGVVNEYDDRKKLNCMSGTLVWDAPNIPEAASLYEEFMSLMQQR